MVWKFLIIFGVIFSALVHADENPNKEKIEALMGLPSFRLGGADSPLSYIFPTTPPGAVVTPQNGTFLITNVPDQEYFGFRVTDIDDVKIKRAIPLNFVLGWEAINNPGFQLKLYGGTQGILFGKITVDGTAHILGVPFSFNDQEVSGNFVQGLGGVQITKTFEEGSLFLANCSLNTDGNAKLNLAYTNPKGLVINANCSLNPFSRIHEGNLTVSIPVFARSKERKIREYRERLRRAKLKRKPVSNHGHTLRQSSHQSKP